MFNEMYESLAKIVIHYSLSVQKGHRVLIMANTVAKDLIQALYFEIIKVGAHPFALVDLEDLQTIFYKYASQEQLLYVDNINKQMMKEFDRLIQIKVDYNTQKLANIDPKRIMMRQGSEKVKELREIMGKREAQGEFRWNIVPFPCQSFAQDAKMDLLSYTDFLKKALFLDKRNPLDEWKKLKQEQERLINILNNFKKIEVIGEETNLNLSVEGRMWLNSWGDQNLPGGEVFTSPVEESVNGQIKFTYPGLYMGKEAENIVLEFKDGKVIKANADKGEDLLNEILKIENANIMGELGIGTNYGITQYTKNMLFDEKIGGTIHCALGGGFQDAGSKNLSAVHWDILKDMKPAGSKILADGDVIYEKGYWQI